MSRLDVYLEQAQKETLSDIPDDYTRASEIATRIRNGRIKIEDVNVPQSVRKILDVMLDKKLTFDEKYEIIQELQKEAK